MASYSQLPDEQDGPRLQRKESDVHARVEEILKGKPRAAVPSLAELTWPPDKRAYAGNILSGLVGGLKVVLGMVVFANIVFNSTDNQSIKGLFGIGINLNLLAASVALVWSTLFSDMNALVAPQDVPSIILGQLAVVIARSVRDKAKAGHTLLAACWMSTLLTGVFLWLLGRLHASDMLRKIPSPVIGGFIAATGATGIRTSLSTLTGAPFYILWPTDLTAFHDWKTWAQLGLAFYSLISMRYLGNWVKPYVRSKNLQAITSPLCLISPILVFYTVLLCRGSFFEDLEWIRSIGWMYPAMHHEPFYNVWSETLRFSQIEWSTLLDPSVVGSLVVLAALTSLSATLSIIGTVPVVPCASNIGGLGGKVDLDKELVVLGSGQVMAGLMTGLPGYTQTALSANLYIFGGTHRLAEFVATGFVVLTTISGIPIAHFIPKFFLGAVFLNLGLSFCKTYLVDNLGLMGAESYCSMLFIVFVGLWKDLTMAVAVGIVMQIALMVRQAASINPVFQCGSFDGGFISSRIRPMSEASRLRWHLDGRMKNSVLHKLEVVRLQGPIFFGNCPSLEDDVESLIRLSPVLSHLVLDMSRVTQVDDSAARALARILTTARAEGLSRFAVAGANDAVRAQFEKHLLTCPGTSPAFDLYPALDDALEVYEDELLVSVDVESEWLKPERLSDEVWDIIKGASSQELNLQSGELLGDFGKEVDGLCLLVRGNMAMATMRASVCGTRQEQIVAKYAAPMVIGAAAFLLDAARHAFRFRARGQSGATLLVFTQADLKGLETAQPGAYIALLKNAIGYGTALESNHLRWRAALSQ